MATIFGTNKYAEGQNITKGGPPGALFGVDFDTNILPGVNPGNVQLLANDEIRLIWLPPSTVVEWYSIDIDDADGGTTLVLSLRDGAGNVYNAALATGQAGGRITAVTAAAHMVGVPQVYTAAQAYMTLLATTQAASAPGQAIRVTGNFVLRRI